MNPKINAPISEQTQKYDGIIALSEVKFDKDNIELYGIDETNYFKGLTKSIKENGLYNPIVLYNDYECKSNLKSPILPHMAIAVLQQISLKYFHQ